MCDMIQLEGAFSHHKIQDHVPATRKPYPECSQQAIRGSSAAKTSKYRKLKISLGNDKTLQFPKAD